MRGPETRLEGLGAEGLHVEMSGVFWLVVGVVLDTIPGEVALYGQLDGELGSVAPLHLDA